MKRHLDDDKFEIKTIGNNCVFFSTTDAIKDPTITQRKTDARHVDICIDRTFRISYEDQS